MKDPAIIISVQHTGTRSLMKFLDVPFDHCWDRNMPMLRRLLRGGTQGYVPMRDPALVFESWYRRGPRPGLDIKAQYMALIGLDEEFDLFYVDIRTVPGAPITQYNTVNAPITPEMQARVPDWVRNWYDGIELRTAREAAGDIRERSPL